MKNLHQIKTITKENIHLFFKLPIIGIDISKLDFHYAIPQKQNYLTSNNSMNIAGFKSFLKDCKKNHAQFMVCMEVSGGYEANLCKFLHEHEVPVYLISGRTYKSFRQEHQIKIKSDKQDPITICNIAKTHLSLNEMKSIRLYAPIPEEIELLKAAFFAYQKAKETNSLYTMWSNEMPKRYELLQEDHKRIKENEKICEKRLHNMLKEFPEYKYMVSIPGVGHALIAYMLILTHGFTRINTGKQAAAMFGLAPYDFSSGTSVNPNRKKSIPSRDVIYKKARFVAVFCTISAMQHNHIIKSFRDRLVSRNGKSNTGIRTALARKLVVMTFVCGKKFIMFENFENYQPQLTNQIVQKSSNQIVSPNQRLQIMNQNQGWNWIYNKYIQASNIHVKDVCKFIFVIKPDEAEMVRGKIELFFESVQDDTFLFEAKIMKTPQRLQTYTIDDELVVVIYHYSKEMFEDLESAILQIRNEMLIPHEFYIKEEQSENCAPAEIVSRFKVKAGQTKLIAINQ